MLQLSVAVALNSVTLMVYLQKPSSVPRFAFEGQVITGNWLSVTVTVNEQVAVFELPSVTLNVFVVTPTGKLDPLANPVVCIVDAPGQLSVPTGVE